MTHIEFLASQEQRIEDAWQSRELRKNLTEEQKTEALRIGRIEFASAGAVRKR